MYIALKMNKFGILIVLCFVIYRSDGGRDPLIEAMEFIQNKETDEFGAHLSTQETELMLKTLWERSGCIESANQLCIACLPVDTLFGIVGADTNNGLSNETFPKASVVLAYYLFNFSEVCHIKPDTHNYTWYLMEVMTAGVGYIETDDYVMDVDKEVFLTEEGLSFILYQINRTYIPLSSVKSFYANTLFNDASVDANTGANESQTESICAYMISNLLHGDSIGKPIYVQPNEFIDEIYFLYGKGEILTPEGFDEIMTSLGIGEESHSAHSLVVQQDNMYQLDESDSHNPETIHECLSSHEILHTFEITDDVGIDKSHFQEICPSLIQQLLDNHCEHNHETPPEGPPKSSVYGWGTLSVLIISLLSLLGAATIPMLNTTTYDALIQVFIALAIGTLSGDAFLHLMPEALGLHSHEEGHEDEGNDVLWKNLAVVLSLYVFFLFEKGSKNILGGHSHSHSHGRISPDNSENNREVYATNEGFEDDEVEEQAEPQNKTDIVSISLKESEQSTSKPVDDKNGGINSLNAMILISDGIHNLMDGLAIGVAFTASISVGISTCIAVIFHELPHELGDFAVLVNNGLTVKKALLCNFGTACMAFIGLYIGIIAGEGHAIHQWVFAVTAGMFIYVSLVDLMPELDHSKSSNPCQTFLLQNLGLLLGWALMVLIAYFEDDLKSL